MSLGETPNTSAFGRRLVSIRVAASLVCILLGVAQTAADPCPTQCASGKIPLAGTAPTSGQAAALAFGAQTVRPVEIAINELNAAGGLMGIPVELAVADDQCELGHAINAANRQVEQDKINFVIGPTCPAAAMAAAPIYAKSGVVQLLPTVTVAMLGDIRPTPEISSAWSRPTSRKRRHSVPILPASTRARS